jgi:HSP20 family protein
MANQQQTTEKPAQAQPSTDQGREAQPSRTQQAGEQTTQPSARPSAGMSVRREPSLAAQLATPFGLSPFSLSPFGFVRRMMEDLDRLMSEVGSGSSATTRDEGHWLQSGFWSPQVEVFQRGDNLIVRADLPGMAEQDVRIDVVGDTLVIEGERREEQEEREGGFYRTEVRYGRSRRAIPLPEGTDVESADARLENGVLEIAFKLPEQQRARRIDVKPGGGQGEEKDKSVH